MLVLGIRDVTAVEREIERGVRFAVFPVAVGQLADEMFLIAPLGPRLT